MAIFNILKRHSARKVVHIDGIAASIASVIAMAGDEINIAANGFVMIHEASAFAFGDAAELRKRADQLEKVTNSILDTYAERTGTPENVIGDMMAAETWMNAEDAVEHGFADNITDEVAIAAHFDLAQFQNVPENVAAKIDLAKNPPKVDLGGGSGGAAAAVRAWHAGVGTLNDAVAAGAVVGAKGPELLVPKIQAVTFGTADDKIYVLNDWPERIAVSAGLLREADSSMLKVVGDLVLITTENGTAEYRKDGETPSGDWTLARLAGAIYSAVDWPLEQASDPDPDTLKKAAAKLSAAGNSDDQPRTPSLAITKMKQHIQKRGIVRKDDETAATA